MDTDLVREGLLPFVRSLLAPHRADALYLHRWFYGTSGLNELSRAQLLDSPEMAYLTERTGEVPRRCIQPGQTRWGKILVRAGSAFHRHDMHSGRGPTVLSNGQAFNVTQHPSLSAASRAALSSLPLAEREPCASTPLSINHYATGTAQSCLRRARWQWSSKAHKKRREVDCLGPSRGLQFGRQLPRVMDTIVSMHANATRRRRALLFTTSTYVNH